MHKLTSAMVCIAVAASLASRGLAQNDECTGAVSVAQGPNGPYTNVGSTTSVPAWPCAAGGADVWFAYLAPGTGTLTADVCGASYDSAIEIFDGSLGCGSLTSLGCNDDSCGLQSSLTVSVTTGVTYYIRVGGFGSSTGTFTLNINGPTGGGTVATATAYGAGCVNAYTSFYENFATSAAFDLANNGYTMLFTGTGYTMLPAVATYVAPSATATVLALTDDSQTSVTLSSPFPYAAGATSSLNVCSNGFITDASGNGTAFTPSVNTLLNGTQTGWYAWHDYNPAAAGSGQVKFEEVGSLSIITWDGVYDFGGTSSASANTFQFQFDRGTGMVHVLFGTMSTAGNARLVGYSPGGSSLDPGSMDISTALAGSWSVGGVDVPALSLVSTTRPVLGTTWTLTTNNIPAGTPFGALLLGLVQYNPGIPLAAIGMPGCSQYTDGSVPLLYVVPTGSAATNVPVPNNASLVGLHLFAQSAANSVTSNSFGWISSNGIDGALGNL